MRASGLGVLAQRLKTAAHVALAFAPTAVKVPIYRRVYGFRIGKNVRIGVSVLDVKDLDLADGAEIGHGNVLTGSDKVTLGRGAKIGFCNLIRGGRDVRLDDYAWVMRFNVLNSIPNPEIESPADPRLHLGKGACVVSGHRLDFTDRIELGTNVVVAGRNSSLWTHNRQQTKPIVIDDYCYLGSEVRLAPGASLAHGSMLGLGAVLTKAVEDRGVIVAGVPAKVLRETTAEEQARLRKKTRREIPDDAY